MLRALNCPKYGTICRSLHSHSHSHSHLRAASSRGLSLVETLLVIAITAILAASAAPSLAALARESRLVTSANDLLGTLYFARSEALKRNRRVSICTTISRSECASSIGWQHGWIVFEDLDEDGDRDEIEQILLLSEPRGGSIVIGGSSPIRDYISYVSTGQTRAFTGALQMGVLTLCDQGAGRQVIISATGRPRIAGKLAC